MKNLVVLFILLCNTCAYALDSNDFQFSFTHGWNVRESDIEMYEFGVEYDLDKKNFGTEVSIEADTAILQLEDDEEYFQTLALALKCDLIKELLYIKYNFGIGLLSNRDAFGKEYGSNFQFKNSLALGHDFKENWSIEGGFSHYSTGAILGPEDENDGIDLFRSSIIFRF